MNVAVILAGGVGSRLGANIPKQYIEVKGKPIIVYTLERFQNAEVIDCIEVVCAGQYMEYVRELGKKYGITKLRWVSEGGSICQESIRNGIFALQEECGPDDVVMLHMSVSPMISNDTIEEAVRVCKLKGNSFAVQPCLFCMCKKVNEEWSDQNAYKEDYLSLNMPWTFRYHEIYDLYKMAYEKNIGTDLKSYTPSLMFDMGKKVYLFRDNDENRLKITTRADLDLFEAYLILQEQRKNTNQEE